MVCDKLNELPPSPIDNIALEVVCFKYAEDIIYNIQCTRSAKYVHCGVLQVRRRLYIIFSVAKYVHW